MRPDLVYLLRASTDGHVARAFRSRETAERYGEANPEIFHGWGFYVEEFPLDD